MARSALPERDETCTGCLGRSGARTLGLECVAIGRLPFREIIKAAGRVGRLIVRSPGSVSCQRVSGLAGVVRQTGRSVIAGLGVGSPSRVL